MEKFKDDQINRQDFVDNGIFDLVKRLNPSKREIEWDIGRNVLRKPRLLGGLKGHDVKENTLPGSTALWAGSFQ